MEKHVGIGLCMLALALLVGCATDIPVASTPPITEPTNLPEDLTNGTNTRDIVLVDQILSPVRFNLTDGTVIDLACLREPLNRTTRYLDRDNRNFYAESQAMLTELLTRQPLDITPAGGNNPDWYFVTAGGNDINFELTAAGLADVSVPFSYIDTCLHLSNEEDDAQLEGRGMWYFEAFCGDNLYDCSDFVSQQQAQQVLERCGAAIDDHNLDDDGDGLACERPGQFRD